MGRALPLLFVSLVAGCACGERTHILLSPCAGENPDPNCGRPCESDAQCGIGFYCNGETCASDCELGGDDCGPGQVCDLRGRCVDGHDAGPPPPPDDAGCPSIDLDLEPTIPTVVLLLDQSGSMTEDFSGIPRWDAMVQSLVDPATGVVTTLETTVRFGATLYTSHDGDNGGECPILIDVPPALDNFVAIRDMLAANAPDGDTPTGDAIDGVVATLQGLDPALAPFQIVLATDGEPDTCEVPNPQNGQAEAIAAAQAAFAAGFHVYVLGVGNDVGAPHLQDMANAGAGVALGGAEPYYTANDPAALADAFGDIIRGVRTCTFTLSGAVDMDEACEGIVTLNDGVLVCNGPDGWRLIDETTMELVGAACDTVLNAFEVRLTAEFPCGAIII